MKYRQEKTHPGLGTSLRSGENASRIVGDPFLEWRDREEEQKAAFRKPEERETRVLDDESDQGRTR